MTKLNRLLALNAGIALFTFSYAAAHPTPCYYGGYSTALYEGPCDTTLIALGALTAGAFWPLYWSWEAWELAGRVDEGGVS